MSKDYGLIIPGKQKEESSLPTNILIRPSIFADESSDSMSNDDLPKVRGKLKAPTVGPGAMERRQARSIQQKALAEDPTIFQYDELYDEIETKRVEEKKSKTTEEKKPKYIGRLLQQAERRKLENERRIERQVQKEREAEGEQFKDKESFVTPAYKKKLEELKEAEEAEKREEYLESIGDVTKQGNLDGFYRHLYEQKLGPKENNDEKQSIDKTIENNSPQEDSLQIKPNAKPRTYRKRQSSEDEDNENLNLKKAHIQSNLDADSDFSIDDSSSEDENEKKNEMCNNDKTITNENEILILNIKTEPGIPSKIVGLEEKCETNVALEDPKVEIKAEQLTSEDTIKEEKPKPKAKIDIWKKRTIGDIFDAALQRYYERKSAKNG